MLVFNKEDIIQPGTGYLTNNQGKLMWEFEFWSYCRPVHGFSFYFDLNPIKRITLPVFIFNQARAIDCPIQFSHVDDIRRTKESEMRFVKAFPLTVSLFAPYTVAEMRLNATAIGAQNGASTIEC